MAEGPKAVDQLRVLEAEARRLGRPVEATAFRALAEQVAAEIARAERGRPEGLLEAERRCAEAALASVRARLRCLLAAWRAHGAPYDVVESVEEIADSIKEPAED